MCSLQVLQSFKIMDYSLLLAIHKVEETVGVSRYQRSNSEPAETPSGQFPPSPDDLNGQQDTRAASPGWIPP